MSTDNSSDKSNTLFGFPINRVVAFLTPFTVLIAGKVGLWLFANVPLFSSLHIGGERISKALVQIFAFAIPAILTYLTHHTFLKGWQGWEQAVVHASATPAVTVVNTDTSTVDDETDIPAPGTQPTADELSGFTGDPPSDAGAPPVTIEGGTPAAVPGIEPEGDTTKFAARVDEGETA